MNTPASFLQVLLSLATLPVLSSAVARDVSAAAAMTPADTLSQPAPPDTLDRVFEMPTIVVTASRSQSLIVETPDEVRVVNAGEAADRLAAGLPEALGGAPEIHVQRTGLGGGSPILRGLSGNRVLLMVDGIRLNNSVYRAGVNQYMNTVDVGMIDQVEVAPGPGSVLYGSDAMGGVVNILSVAPGSQGPLVRYSGQVTSAEGSHTHSARVSRWWGNGGLVLGGSRRDLNDLRGGGDIGVQIPTGYSDWSGYARLLVEPRANDRLTLAWQTTRQTDVPRTDRVRDGRDSLNLYDPQNRDLAYLRYDAIDLIPGVASARGTLSWNHQKEGRRVIATGATTRQDDLDDVHTLGASLEGRSGTGSETLLIYGAEVYRDEVASRTSFVDLESGAVTPGIGKLPDDGEHLSTGAFFRLQDPIGPRLTLIGALRHSYLHLTGTPRGPFGKVSVHNRNLTGSVESKYSLSDDTFVFAGVSQAFRAPNMEDALSTGLTNKGWDVPNPDLEPERSVSVETGIKITRRASGDPAASRAEPWRYHLEATLHASRIHDLMERSPTTFQGSDSLDGEPVFRNENVGTGQIAGLSLSGDVRPGAGFRLAAGAAWTYGERRDNGAPLTRIPPFRGTASVRRSMRRGWLELAGEWAARQDRLSPDDLRDSRIPAGGTPGYFVAHLRTAIHLGNDIDLRLVLENLGDREYRVHGSGIDMPGRNLTAGLTWRCGSASGSF